MPLETNLNVPPYFDDYDESKSYYRVLFKPSIAVQARELTQIQSIIQNQIERFGQWAFQNGDIVQGCSIIDVPALSYVRLSDNASNSSSNSVSFSATSLINTFVRSTTSNLTAQVILANTGFYSYYPNTNIVYIKYLNTGTGGQTSYSNNELLNFYIANSSGNTSVANVYTLANTTANTFTTGNAHAIIVDSGIIFINGEFVKIQNTITGIVNNYGTYAGNTVVGFQLVETVVNSDQDSSLNDNALGYSNFNAPGADRLQLTPYLVALSPAIAANTTNFNPIATYNYGSLITKSSEDNVYSVVGDAIAQRIYDEAGNYVVNPFVIDTVTGTTGTSVVASLDANSVLGRISPGVGYSQGQRVEIQKTAYIQMRRGVDTQSFLDQQITFNYGGYFVVDELSGVFTYNTAQTVNLYDTPQQSITNRTFESTTPIGNVIGTATLRNFSLLQGIVGANTTQYYIHVYNIKMNSGFNTSEIMSIVNPAGAKGFADVISNQIISGSSEQLYSFAGASLKNLRDSSNNIGTEYIYGTSTTSSSLSNTGQVVVTITSSAPGGVDILPYGVGTIPPTSDIIVVPTANATSAALAGNVTVSSVSTNVVGVGTNFLTNFYQGDQIEVGSTVRTIAGVTNSTVLIVDAPFGSNASGQTYYKYYPAGKPLQYQYNSTGSNNGSITVTNTTSFTINTNQTLTGAGTTPVQVFYNVLRTSAVPAAKVINKNVFVRINIANNSGGPNGPWSLGFTDIHKVNYIYGSTDINFGTYTNITNYFTYDTGQKDTHYDIGNLYPLGGFNANSYPYLLVSLDYFTVNNTPGCGFFTVESYPIDDVNTSNTTAIQTKDIPLYVDKSGNARWLRNYVDFRTPGLSVANSSNTIAGATINPNNSLSFIIPSGGLNSPAYGKNFQANYTQYLPRIDLAIITPDNKIKVIEGRSSTTPQTPIYPDNSMAVGIINVPPFPSLSSDQVDNDSSVNRLSKNLIRDTSTAISVTMVTNRRYTMSDIGKIDTRLSNLEYYMQLSLLQQNAASMVVTDANGLNRYKNGIFVDSFNDYIGSDVSNPEYRIAIDQVNGQARPYFVVEKFKVNFNANTSSTQKTGRLITLPYVQANGFVNQPYATKYRSAAHVQSQWNGVITLLPCYSDTVDTQNTASVGITINNATPWQQFANSPFGSIWGAWNTTTTSNSTTVTSGTVSNNTITVAVPPQLVYSAGLSQYYQSLGYTIGTQSIDYNAVAAQGATTVTLSNGMILSI